MGLILSSMIVSYLLYSTLIYTNTFLDGHTVASVSLTSVPNFLGIECGINEVEEILSYLTETDATDDHSYFRPEKILRAFAVSFYLYFPIHTNIFQSKACRRSVMVGDTLEVQKMQSIVNHLSLLDKPWVCIFFG